jgi:hypothetical protein
VSNLAHPTLYVFELHSSWACGANNRFNLNVWGFFSLAGALHFCRTQRRGRRCWIAAEPPRGFIQRYTRLPGGAQPEALTYGKVYRRVPRNTA